MKQLSERPRHAVSLSTRPCDAITAHPRRKLPAEVVEIILEASLISATDDKRLISKFAKVCMRWNSRCRPSLFRRLTLLSADDLHALLQIIRSSEMISTYVTHIVAVVHASRTPWAYLVPLLLPTALPQLRHLSQILIPDVPLSHRSISFLTQAFYARFSALTTLKFGGCHFRDFYSLARILVRIECLERLQCHHVTWGGNSCTQMLPNGLRTTAFRALRQACLKAGSDHCEFYRLFSRRAFADTGETLQHRSNDLLCALRSVFPKLGRDPSQFYTQYDLYEGEPEITPPELQ